MLSLTTSQYHNFELSNDNARLALRLDIPWRILSVPSYALICHPVSGQSLTFHVSSPALNLTILLRKLNLFDSFVKEKVQLLEGVRREFEDVRGELQHMQAFLRVADSIEDRHRHGVQIKVWVEQVRDAAHDMEDVIDEFMLRLAHHHHGHGFYASIKKISFFVKNLRARHRIASDIQGIKIRVKGISEKYKRYKDEKIVELGSSSSPRANIEALAADEDDLVGIQKPKAKLISWLLEGSTGRDVIPVSGMGGLGKTTLVKQVYEDAEVKKHFKTRVWVVVSRSFEEDLQELCS